VLSVNLLEYLSDEQEDENMEQDQGPDDDEPLELSSNFDIKKFRQNLKAGNFYDGKSHQTVCLLSLIQRFVLQT
jgi:hypothetical protein